MQVKTTGLTFTLDLSFDRRLESFISSIQLMSSWDAVHRAASAEALEEMYDCPKNLPRMKDFFIHLIWPESKEICASMEAEHEKRFMGMDDNSTSRGNSRGDIDGMDTTVIRGAMAMETSMVLFFEWSENILRFHSMRHGMRSSPLPALDDVSVAKNILR